MIIMGSHILCLIRWFQTKKPIDSMPWVMELVSDENKVLRVQQIEVVGAHEKNLKMCDAAQKRFGDDKEALNCPGNNRVFGPSEDLLSYCLGTSDGTQNLILDCRTGENKKLAVVPAPISARNDSFMSETLDEEMTMGLLTSTQFHTLIRICSV